MTDYEYLFRNPNIIDRNYNINWGDYFFSNIVNQNYNIYYFNNQNYDDEEEDVDIKYKIICNDGTITILKTTNEISIISDAVQTDFEIKCDMSIEQVKRAITIMIEEVNYTDDDFHNLDNYMCLYNKLQLNWYDKIQSIKLFYEERQKRIFELARIKYLVRKNKCSNSSFNNFNSNLGELELFKTIAQFV